MFASYDYKCNNCTIVFERFVLKKEKDEQKCYECFGPTKRLMPGPATTFKFNDGK